MLNSNTVLIKLTNPSEQQKIILHPVNGNNLQSLQAVAHRANQIKLLKSLSTFQSLQQHARIGNGSELTNTYEDISCRR